MGKRDTYEAGTFSWAELASTDADAAKEFYGKLFGWSYEDVPAGDDGVYTMASADGGFAAALMQADGPARWNSYISVDDVDAVTKQAEEAGATVHAGPFDVMEAGRMSVIQDPTGGVVSLWQAGDRAGADVVNVHGALTWNDLMTYEVGEAAEFYCELLGWEVAEIDMDGDNSSDADSDDGDDARGPEQRFVIRNGEKLNGGIATIPKGAGEAIPPHWLPYFAVDDIETAASAVADNGGELMAGPIKVPTGQMAVAADPAGAVFGLYAGELDD